MVSYMDKLVGRIVDKAVKLGIAENTLMLVTGDNGTHTSLKSNMGDGRLIDVKNDVFEQLPVEGHEHIRSRLQAVLDRMPAEGQSLLRYE